MILSLTQKIRLERCIVKKRKKKSSKKQIPDFSKCQDPEFAKTWYSFLQMVIERHSEYDKIINKALK